MIDVSKMTPEERLAHEAWAHLSKTQCKSMEAGCCVYAGSGCAFAPAILPGEREGLDKMNITSRELLNLFPTLLEPWTTGCDPFFAREVQNAHDGCLSENGPSFVAEFASRLHTVCRNYGVAPPAGMAEYLDSHGESIWQFVLGKTRQFLDRRKRAV